jgi:hypothetical protein
MKNIFKTAIVCLTISIFVMACNTNDNDVAFDAANDAKLFEESVALKTTENVNLNGRTDKVALTYEAINYNDEYQLKAALIINGHAYSDDGKYNDEVAGDNIYTSVDLFEASSEDKNSKETTWGVSDKFKYKEQFLQERGFTIKCKVRHVPCSGESFWSSDWGTGWGCLEFYDCETTWEW